jgi:S1-C subfamily serine protease/uncharacterized membrane protein YfcA
MKRKPDLLDWRRCLIPFLLVLALQVAALSFPARVSAIVSPDALVELQRDVKTAIARVRPAVVKISSYGVRLTPEHGAGAGQAATATPYRTIGTGVIIDPRGYVLTNAHVVKHASNVSVELWRAQPVSLSGRVFHFDERQDLAIVQLTDKGPYPYAVFGKKRGMNVGQRIIAIGSPYGFAHSVSMGIVSNRSRTLWIEGKPYKDLIQTDASINQGNSGGPLINLKGEVVGISMAIYAPDGTSAGVGFAIPAFRALSYINRVMPGAQLARAAAEKEPIRPDQKNPHSTSGNCLDCHTFITPPPKPKGPKTVAMTQPLASPIATKQAPSALRRVGVLGSTYQVEPSGNKKNHPKAWDVIPRTSAIIIAIAALFNMLGLGGGYLYVPLLLHFGVPFGTASATSLAIICAAHFSALYVFMRSRLIDYRLALVLEPLTCIGAFIGGLSSDLINEKTLLLMFSSVLLIAALFMHQKPMTAASPLMADSSKWSWHRTFGPYRYTINLPLGLLAALVIGYLGGTLGFAGGVIKVPMMVILFGVPIKVAIATSSLMVSFTSMVGVIGHGFAGDFDPQLSIALAVAAIIGAQIGSRLTVKTDRLILKRIIAVVLLVMAVWMTGKAL